MSTKLSIKKFNMDTIKQDRMILIVGKRGTGKSTLLKDLLYRLRKKIDIGIAMTPTLDTVKMFEECIPRSLIYNDYRIEVVKTMLASMKSLEQQEKLRHALLVMDDCMFDKSILKTKEMREIHMNGRHFKLSFINCMQYVMDMGPDLRSQIDYVFALKENIIKNRKKMHENFFGMFNDYKDFSLVMDKCTNNYECLVLDNTKPGNNIEENIFYYKANNKIGKFRVGKKIFFKLDHYYKKVNTEQRMRELQTLKTGKIPSAKLPDPVKIRKRIDTVEKI